MNGHDLVLIFCVIFLFMGGIILTWGVGQTFPEIEVHVVNSTTENISELRDSGMYSKDTIYISDAKYHDIQCMWRLWVGC
jgi:hypothetical protein